MHGLNHFRARIREAAKGVTAHMLLHVWQEVEY
jgi:hypothetical protein